MWIKKYLDQQHRGSSDGHGIQVDNKYIVNYQNFNPKKVPKGIKDLYIADHLGGFRKGRCEFLDNLYREHGNRWNIVTEYIDIPYKQDFFKNLEFHYMHDWSHAKDKLYPMAPNSVQHFVSCFNGSENIGRTMTVAFLLKNYMWEYMWEKEVCSCNYMFQAVKVDGFIKQQVKNEKIVRKFFITQGVWEPRGFDYQPYNHSHNVDILVHKIQTTFLQLVTETVPDSDIPFVTEKFVYPVLSRRPFIAIAQPGWHKFLSDVMGFKLYDEIFDYSFDSEINPVKRWMGVYTQLIKLHTLPADDWIDILFEIKDKIDYNVDHYKSDNFMQEAINYLKNQNDLLGKF